MPLPLTLGEILPLHSIFPSGRSTRASLIVLALPPSTKIGKLAPMYRRLGSALGEFLESQAPPRPILQARGLLRERERESSERERVYVCRSWMCVCVAILATLRHACAGTLTHGWCKCRPKRYKLNAINPCFVSPPALPAVSFRDCGKQNEDYVGTSVGRRG